MLHYAYHHKSPPAQICRCGDSSGLAKTCFQKNDFKDLIYHLSPQSLPPTLVISTVPSKERLCLVRTAVRCIARRVYTEEQILEIPFLKDIVMSDCSVNGASDHIEKWYASSEFDPPLISGQVFTII